MKNLFEGRRLLQLMLNDLRINQKIITISIGLILVFWVLMIRQSIPAIVYYQFVLYVGGFSLTSVAFKELHNSELAYQYLTLPCSNFERFLSKLLLTSLVYALALLALYTGFVVLHYTLSMISLNHYDFLDAFIGLSWQSIAKYIVLDAVVLLGAAFFKRHVIIKTLLSVFSILTVFSIATGSLSLQLYPFWVPGVLQHADGLSQLVFYSFWIALAPFCWLVTYQRIRECEIK